MDPIEIPPLTVYFSALGKGGRKKKNIANAILMAVSLLSKDRRYISLPGVPQHKLVKAVMAARPEIKSGTTIHRLLPELVQYNVLTKIIKKKKSRRVYYESRISWGSPSSPKYKTPLPPNLSKTARADLSRLYIQAESARRVLARHGLTEEWTAECEKMTNTVIVEGKTMDVRSDEYSSYLLDSSYLLNCAAGRAEDGKM
ncbi:MAG TPA: hypothetical protein HA263_11100 [Methanoregulaceae archaeon]|nr:hypothetical protein [Methanoregulaceae archaeon]